MSEMGCFFGTPFAVRENCRAVRRIDQRLSVDYPKPTLEYIQKDKYCPKVGFVNREQYHT